MRHQIKIIWGNLKKTKVTTSLNIIGLTCAFTAFIIIMLYVWNEYHFDGFQKNIGEIYRLEAKGPEDSKTSVFMLGPTGKSLVSEYPEIINSTIYMPWGKWAEQPFFYDTPMGEQNSYEDFSYGDENLTDIFTFQFIYSNSKKPLSNPESAIVSSAFAQKAWGQTDPVGKLLRVSGTVYTVTGVFRELPENTVFRCPIILRIPTGSWLAKGSEEWGYTNYPQFILVKPGTDPKHLNKIINESALIKSKYNFFDNGKTTAQIVARPLGDLRFTRDVSETPMFESNNKMFVDSLFLVGILIMLVALINYVNFATALAPQRMKTISINHVIGCSRFQSIAAMMIETIALFVFSFGLGVIIAYLLNPLFSSAVLGYELPFIQNRLLLVNFGAVTFLASLAVGIYPALMSTSGKPIESLKRNKTNSRVNFRGILTVSQFAATIALLVASVSIIKQVRFMKETNLGFNKNNTLVIRMTQPLQNNFHAFKDQLKSSPFIKEVACSRTVPGQAMEGTNIEVEGKYCFVWSWAVDDIYMDMMDFKIKEGRGFLNKSEAENGNFICNETAAKMYNWKVGMKAGNRQLVGIMKDFNLVSLREKVDPFIFWKSNSYGNFNCISIKFQGDNVSQALADIQKVYNEYSPQVPFRSYFLDDHLNLLYVKENQQTKLITLFSILSVVVSILGILGLSIFLCQNKIKEIGIRKVNGAKVSEILALLNFDFVKWVFLAFIVATPLAWFAMHTWLESFAFKTTLSWWIFALSGIIALGIALLTVSWQSWQAATRNPVEALRYE